MEKKKKLIMLSLDAVSTDDLDILLAQPNFSKLREKSTLVKEVSSVYISNTYPAHTSIITGVHPNKHGIIENLFLDPNKKAQDWRYKSELVKMPTLYKKAKEKGMTVCAILYPVTGGADIDYNFPEIAGEMSALKRVLTTLKEGSKGYMLSQLMRYGRGFKGSLQPALDDFTTNVAADTLKRYKPDLLMLHLIDTDDTKHIYGPESPEAKASIIRHDGRLRKLTDALKEAGTYEETEIIVFSDHGCLPVEEVVEPNNFLEKIGLIEKAPFICHGYFHNAGGSAFLKLYNSKKKNEALKALEEIKKEPYIERLITDEEMEISGMARDYIGGIEAKYGYCFGKKKKGQHGYGLKRKGYYPFYMACGEKIPQGGTLSGGCIVDICPLAASMLHIPLWEMDGINRVRQASI